MTTLLEVPARLLTPVSTNVAVVVAPLGPWSDAAAVRAYTRAGTPLAQAVEGAGAHPSWTPYVRRYVTVNGCYEPNNNRVLEEGDYVVVYPEQGANLIFEAAIFALQIAASVAIQYGLNLLINKAFGPSQPSTATNDNIGKPTYGWTGPQTVYEQGAPVPVGYGQMQTGGQVISYYITNDGKRSYVNMLLFISEGKIHSIGGVASELNEVTGASIPDRIWVGNVRLKQFDRVQIWTRLGLLDQEPIPGFNDQVLQYAVGQDLVGTSRTTVVYRTVNDVDKVRLRIEFPEGVYVVAGAEGQMYSQRIDFRYRFREITNGSVAGEWSDWVTFYWRILSTSPAWRDKEVELPSIGQWEFEVERTSGVDPDWDQVRGKANLQAVLEVRERDFEYPRGALLAFKALATEGLNGARPQLRIEYEGREVRQWDGSAYTNELFTSNPWWVALDILQNTHYGLGEYLRNVDIPVDDFLDAATEADELVPSGQETLVRLDSLANEVKLFVADTTGFDPDDTVVVAAGTAREETIEIDTIEGDAFVLKNPLTFSHTRTQGDQVQKYHERYKFDGAFDEAGDAWEAVQTVAKAARGVILKIGNRLVLKRAVQQDPILIVNEGNARNVRVQYINRRTQANEWRGQFLKRKDNDLFQPDSLAVQATDSILDNASLVNYYSREGRRTDDVRMVGVTRTEQVRRDLNFKKRYTRNSNRILNCELPLEAIGTFPGRVFGFAHKVLGVTANGRVLADAASAGNTITLDRDVTVGSGTYVIHVRADDDTLVERTISSGAGTYARGATITITGTWPDGISKYAPYSFGLQGSALLLYEIIKWRFIKDLWIDIEALNYDPNNYMDSDAA